MTKTIYRINKNKDNPFVQIDKRPLSDKRLSWKAKGILAYLMSKPDDWEVIFSDIEKQSTDKQRAVRSGLQELQDAGYVWKAQERGSSGQITKHLWIVFEEPQKKPPQVGGATLTKRKDGGETILTFSRNGKSRNGKKHTTNNELTNNKLNGKKDANASYSHYDFMTLLAEVTGTDLELNKGHYAREAKTLKKAGYSLEQVKEIYGDGGAWWKEDWRGKKGQRPTVKQIRETIKELSNNHRSEKYDPEKYKKGKFAEFIKS